MKKIFFILSLLLFSLTKTIAQNNLPPVFEIKTDTAFQQYLSTEYWQFLEDKAGKWVIWDVSRSPLASQFHDSLHKAIDTTLNTYWFRYRLKNIMSYDAKIALDANSDQVDFYLLKQNGKWEHFVTGYKYQWNKKDGLKNGNYVPVSMMPGEELLIYQRINNVIAGLPKRHKIDIVCTEKAIQKELSRYDSEHQEELYSGKYYFGAIYFGIILFAAFLNFFFFLIAREKEYLYFSLSLLSLFFLNNPLFINVLYREYSTLASVINGASVLFLFFFLQFIRYYFKTFKHTPRADKGLFVITISTIYLLLVNELRIVFLHAVFYSFIYSVYFIVIIAAVLALLSTISFYSFKNVKANRSFRVAILPYVLIFGISILVYAIIEIFHLHYKTVQAFIDKWADPVTNISIVWMVLVFSWILFKRFDEQRKEIAQQAFDKERLAKEKEIERAQLIEQQKVELEKTVEERTFELKNSLQELKSTQAQLIQSEKMASLGELTAGIAHEIQNPLNFVNNFSEVNKELIEELKSEIPIAIGTKGNTSTIDDILNDIEANEEKINFHGKRADAIVKGMLQHSRQNNGIKEPTDINALCDEYLRLSYHGLRAKDKSFNAEFTTNLDVSVGKINLVAQDISRVLLNLYNNAFYAVNERLRQAQPDSHYQPTVSVSTRKTENSVTISVSDNGSGILQNIIDKIFQPFFTTKPTGEGTGLGLSLAYDIITKQHGGNIHVNSKEGEGSEFVIMLPVA